MQTFLMRNVLIFPNIGLAVARQNEMSDEIIHFARQTFFPNCVRGKPLIRLGRSRLEKEVFHGGGSQKHRVTCQSESHGRSRWKQSFLSCLEMLMRIIGSQREWISCSLGEKK